MDQAWLDSLSEDWVSQPRSTGSPVPSLPSLSNSTSSNNRASRIPTIAPTKQTVSTAPESPLNVRSTNDNNIPLSQRGLRRPSKLKEELSNSTRGRDPNRRLSASSTQSVIYNTVQHKSHSLSPTKSVHETPEWKKRLLQGDVAYGDQRDLFSPAGLENIFRPPPPPQPILPSKRGPNIEDGSIMPSSPPAFHVKFSRAESMKSSPNNEQEQNEERRQPRTMNYRLADDGSSGFSENDISQSSSFHPKPVTEIPPRSNDQHAASVSNSNMDSSSVQHNEVQGVVQRLVSGQSIMLNEELSPIFISKHNTDDGKIDFAPLDVSAAELQKRLEELSVHNRNQAAEGEEGEEGEVSQLLPGDWTTGTDDFAHNGRFVNLRRGGHSHEGSFQKRLLSPSSLPAIDESAMLPEESIQASTPKQLPTVKKTRASDDFPGTLSLELSPSSVPPAPHPSPAKPDNQSTKSGSGSPLKLFGNYDTFTNAKLLRRLSQFEEHYDDNSQEEFTGGISSREMEATHPEVNQAFVASSSPEKTSHEGNAHSPRRMSSFGKGDLDSFQFSEAISYESNDASLQENNENFDADDDKENVSLPVLDSNVQTKFRFQLDPSPSLKESSVRQRRTKQISTVNTARRTITLRQIIRPDSLTSGNSDASTIIPTSERQDLETPRKRNGDSEGKRLQYSPVKDPTPKRRRTLPKDEFANVNVGKENFEGDSLRDTHQQMQNVIGRKRKDARHENDHQAANPKVLAMRQILRPRTPTPSQRGSVQHERVPLAELTSTERTRLLQQEKIARIQAELDSTNPFKTSMQNDSRKGSVTTQDFLDEAKKIMLAIRGKTRPRSGLTSVEESESETDRNASTGTATHEQDEEDEDSYEESTQEPFSRPPSREGRPVPKVAREQQDPGVLDHLRQYEENSDMDDIIAASMRSIAMVKDAANAAEQIDRIVDETIMRTSGRLLQDGEVESDPPNIRITRNPDLPRKRKHSASTASGNGDTNHDGDFPSHGSTGSGSTTNSVPTGSSRGSDSRRVIAPHTVSHLIPEQLAGMIFDRERNMWVKRKSISGQGEQNFLPSDDTEEDPFGDIPDLSVDETQELQRIKAVAAKRKEEARIAHDTDAATSTLPKSAETSMDISPTQVIPKKSKPETNSRLSSWSEDHDVIAKSQLTQNTRDTRITTHEETRTDFIEEVEREISIHEDRVESTSPRRRRNVTISFSSPLASVIQPAVYNDEATPQPRPAESGSDNESQEDIANSSIILNKRTSNRKVSSTKTRSALRNPSRRLSVGGHTFSARPVSRIDERDEESTGKEQEDEEHDRSVSVIVTTPAPTRHEVRGASVVLATPRPASHEIGTLELTPMSEFTMNQPDESFGLEVSYIARGQRYVPGSGSKKTLSHSIRELVEKLTEVEPFEPFWEHLGKLELKEKKLTSLHKLDEFCEHLEDLDVSKNQIYQLNGAPTTIRHLRISHNCLSDLTAWGHLTNLQYVDISNNEIESLSAFKYQVHLRSLKADNNKIRSLDGIGHLDGLLSLRLRGNLVEAIDFAGTKLQRLNDLDLKNNRVREVRDLQKLTSLQSLNLEDNDLEIFPQVDSVTPWSLKYLKLSGNKLKSLDVSQCPNLRLLYLDRNRLGNVTGFFACKHLDSLSMREQQEDAIINTGFLSEAFEIRKLFLSGNLLLNFAPQVDYLNLQYLELANCGLDCLPENFGQIFSNVRVLNLNFNALKELSSLAGIVRLKKLHVTGNRLARLRKTAVELHQHSSLKSVDLRNNPISLGFYPTVTEKHLVVPSATQDVDGGTVYDPYTLGDADRARDIKYAACLDMETKMRRRIYEILTNGACRKLKFLDGLKADRTITGVRDKVWNALVTAGVVTGELVDLSSPRKDRTQTVPKELAGSRRTASEKEKRGAVRPRTPDRSGVWHAEDSFA